MATNGHVNKASLIEPDFIRTILLKKETEKEFEVRGKKRKVQTCTICNKVALDSTICADCSVDIDPDLIRQKKEVEEQEALTAEDCITILELQKEIAAERLIAKKKWCKKYKDLSSDTVQTMKKEIELLTKEIEDLRSKNKK